MTSATWRLAASSVLGGLLVLVGCERAREIPPMPQAGNGAPYVAPGSGTKRGRQEHTHAPDAPPPPRETPLALKPTGPNSEEEMRTALARLKTPRLAPLFEEAFRETFGGALNERHFNRAVYLLGTITNAEPTFAPAFRVAAYALFNTTGSVQRAADLYERAISLDPSYKEAHYALAGVYVSLPDKHAKGKEHLATALRLGMPDYRDLAKAYAAELPKGP